MSLKATARLIDGSDAKESEAHAYLEKDVFEASRSNAAVRRQVREIGEDIDLLELSAEAFREVQALHTRLAPLIHPGAPDSAQLLIRYIRELGGQQAHFHEYVRGYPSKILGIMTLDASGFDYVARQAGARATYEGRTPTDAMAVPPSYPSAGHQQ
ncbi:hypothetical protein BIU82_00195 [Arthrobacter sp. SW1]|uniref:hypothetical protein n=1 Tax=Arthrobacter sp. SW1 TaxID=1920889 RepID=UPI000877D0FF|nr:hypothetical protein [Arthrobacter sp. SW1]OFI39537.1 hypothetical protein BIU82_00195 [Arthrobacter sp. SW1]